MLLDGDGDGCCVAGGGDGLKACGYAGEGCGGEDDRAVEGRSGSGGLGGE